jgi:TonB family protein
MRNRNNRFISSACAAALLANSFAAFAQHAAQAPKQERERQVVVEQDVIVETQETNKDGLPGQDVMIRRVAPAFGFGFAPGQEPVVVRPGAGGDVQTFSFVSSEMSFDGKVVKGAPYAADAVQEHVQTLADGNRIVNRTTSQVARDGEGRTRREQTFRMVGPWAAGGEAPKSVFINDPVAGVNYVLDPSSKTARKLPTFARMPFPRTPGAGPEGVIGEKVSQVNVIRQSGGVLQQSAVKRVPPAYPAVAKAAGVEGAVQVQVLIGETGQVVSAEALTGHPLLRDAALEAARQWEFKPTTLEGKPVKVKGVTTFNFTLDKPSQAQREGQTITAPPPPPVPGAPLTIATAPLAMAQFEGDGQVSHFRAAAGKHEVKNEDLGKQTIEGVVCEGKRTVITVPAGEIGNERPIETVIERWYSPELQLTVMSKHSDPRSGEHTYRLQNIVRSEPSPALFQVPSDYTLKEGPAFAPGVPGQRFEYRLERRSNEEKK